MSFHPTAQCSRCGGTRLSHADGSPGACSYLGCPAPLFDVNAERAAAEIAALREVAQTARTLVAYASDGWRADGPSLETWATGVLHHLTRLADAVARVPS